MMVIDALVEERVYAMDVFVDPRDPGRAWVLVGAAERNVFVFFIDVCIALFHKHFDHLKLLMATGYIPNSSLNFKDINLVKLVDILYVL